MSALRWILIVCCSASYVSAQAPAAPIVQDAQPSADSQKGADGSAVLNQSQKKAPPENTVDEIPLLVPKSSVDSSANMESVPADSSDASTKDTIESASIDKRIKGSYGLELNLGTGLNFCIPRGEAGCTDLLPGPYYTIGWQYRFWRMGLALNYISGMHIPIGTGAEDVSVRTEHFILDLMGYFPRAGAVEPFAGLGLGYGSIRSSDSRSNSRVEWSSLWQTVRIISGVRGRFPKAWSAGDGWFWETYGSFYFHQGGERCVFYAAQGACRLSEELPSGETDYASTLELGGRFGWSF